MIKISGLHFFFYDTLEFLKFGYSEKATKLEKIFHVKFDVTEYCQILSRRFFQILWPSQNIRTLTGACQTPTVPAERYVNLLHFVVFFYAASLFSTGVDNKKRWVG
jgi:hypothetical protein